jgi:hypothetical protein
MCGPEDLIPLIPHLPVPSVPGLPGLPIVPNLPGFPFGPGLIFPQEPDLSNVEDKEDIKHPSTRLKELEGSGYKKDPANVIVEDFSQVEFKDVHANIQNALEPNRGHNPQDWAGVRNAIVTAIQDFQIALGTLEGLDDAWKGKTHDAALKNLEASYPEPTAAADGAGVQGILESAFLNTISATKQNIEDNWDTYDSLMKDEEYANYRDEIKNAYDTFARSVMADVYRPNIVQIGKDNPAFTAGVTLDVGDNGPGPDGPGPFGPGNGPGSLGAGDLPGPPGTPTMPKIPEFDRPQLPDTPQLPERPDLPTTPPGTPTVPQSLGQPPGGPANPTGAGGGPQPTGANRPPEGVLGLGPKGLRNAPKGGGKGGGAGGKAGGGAGLPRGLAPGKATATPAAAVRAPVAGGGAGAGMGAMGPPGAGAPAAGAAGRDGNKGHQVLKALRRKKTGQQVTGEAEAVVPVVGAPEKPVKPETNQPDQAARQDPPDDGGIRTVSRGPQSTEQATRMPGQ